MAGRLYQINLKPGSLYRLVRLDNRNPSQFSLFRRIQHRDGFALVGEGDVKTAVLLYVNLEHEIGMHRVIYKDVIGLLAANWYLEEIVES